MRLALVALVLTTMVACRAADSGDCTQEITEDCMSTREFTWEEAHAVLEKYRSKIERQPGQHGLSAGSIYGFVTGKTHADGTEAVGIVIEVDELVDQSTLPEEDRIGDCLDGVPVYFWESEGHRMAMGSPATSRHNILNPLEGLRSGLYLVRSAEAVGSMGDPDSDIASPFLKSIGT